MWAESSVFYQIYPLGFCGAPNENDGVCHARHPLPLLRQRMGRPGRQGNRQIIFQREFEGERVFVAINADDQEFYARFNGADGVGNARDLFTGETLSLQNGVLLPPYSFYCWKAE